MAQLYELDNQFQAPQAETAQPSEAIVIVYSKDCKYCTELITSIQQSNPKFLDSCDLICVDPEKETGMRNAGFYHLQNSIGQKIKFVPTIIYFRTTEFSIYTGIEAKTFLEKNNIIEDDHLSELNKMHMQYNRYSGKEPPDDLLTKMCVNDRKRNNMDENEMRTAMAMMERERGYNSHRMQETQLEPRNLMEQDPMKQQDSPNFQSNNFQPNNLLSNNNEDDDGESWKSMFKTKKFTSIHG